MRLPTSDSPSCLRLQAGAYFVLGVFACWMHGLADLPLVTDNQHYFFIAERAASGVPPHLSQFDPKHALGALCTAAAMVLGRHVGVSDLTAARTLSMLVTAAAAPTAWLLTRRLGVRSWAAHLSALCVLACPGFIYIGAVGARPKVFLVEFELLAVYAMAAGRPVVASSFSALAFLTWQPGVILFAAIVPALWNGPKFWQRAAAVGFTFVVINAAYETYFYWFGALGDQIEQAYLFPATYMRSGLPAAPVALQRLGWILDLLPRPGWSSVFPIAAAASLGLLWTETLRHPRLALDRLRDASGHVYVLLCGHAALLVTLANFQGYPDEFLLLPFIALLVAIGFERVRVWIDERVGLRHSVRIAVLTVGFVVLALTVVDSPRKAGLGEQIELGERVGEFLDEGLTVYAVGCTHLLAYNHADNFLPFGFFFRGLDRYLLRRYGTWPFRPYREGALPDVILLSRGPSRFGAVWLERNYARVEDPLAAAQDVRIWRRRESGST